MSQLPMQHIHIVGSGPRTGTTLLAEAMKFCCNIDYATPHEDRLFSRPKHTANVFLTKYPSDLFVVEPSLRLDTNLYIICLIRDPRDAVVSRHGKDKERYWSTLRYWNEFVPIIRKLSNHPRFIPLRYEDFTHSPDDAQQLIVDSIPALRKTHNFTDYHKVAIPSEESKQALKTLRPISNVGIGSWKEHLPRIKQQIQIHGDITPSLIEFDYETSADWQQQLEEVTPYTENSHLPEFFSHEELESRIKYKYLEAVRRLLTNIHLLPNNWPNKSQV
jgi:hypothetical protein